MESAIVGMVIDGNAPLPNGESGLFIGENSKNNIVGVNVLSVIPRSCFSGNLGNGIHISGNSSNNTIDLGFIGLSVLGLDTSSFNNQNGILIDGNAHKNYVGKNFPNTSFFTNYIATNLKYGVQLAGNCYENVIDGNVIGYTIEGDSAPNKLGTISNISSKANTNIIIT